MKLRNTIIPYLVLLPGLLFLVALSIYPLLFSLRISFYRWNLMDPTKRSFVGLRNFLLILEDPDFWHSLRTTIMFVILTVGIEFVLGLSLAILLNREIRGVKIFRSLLLIPVVLAPVVVALVWRFMLNVEYGIINYFFEVIGLGRRDLLGDPIWALPTLVVVDVWQWTPFMFLILLAGLQALPREPYEAARIDGANRWQISRYITLPMLKYPILVALLLRSIDTFRVYDIIFMMTRGGPINATETLSWRVYNLGFRIFDFAYAAALSWIMLIIVMLVLNTFMRLLYRQSEEGF